MNNTQKDKLIYLLLVQQFILNCKLQVIKHYITYVTCPYYYSICKGQCSDYE